MESLRLIAVDNDDLAILSAHCQDAVTRLGDCLYFPARKRFVMAMNRFVWEKAAEKPRFSFFRRTEYERRRAVLHFERVLEVRKFGLDDAPENRVLSLLALRFTETDAPSGSIELVFAGGSAIRLGVECIEARLSDIGGAWSTGARPDHERAEPAG